MRPQLIGQLGESRQSITLTIRSVSGNLVCRLEAQAWWRGCDIKGEVEIADAKLRVAQQRLLYGTKEIGDDTQLAEVVARREAEVTVLFRSPQYSEWLADHAAGRATLRDADPEIRGDAECVMAAVRLDGQSLQYVTDMCILGDEKIVMAAVKSDGLALQYACPHLRGIPEIVMIAVRNDGMALQYASDDLIDEATYVMVAVWKNGLALEYASERLKDIEEVVLIAVAENRKALQYASPKLQCDATFIRRALYAGTLNKHFKVPFTIWFLLAIAISAPYWIWMLGVRQSLQQASFFEDHHGHHHKHQTGRLVVVLLLIMYIYFLYCLCQIRRCCWMPLMARIQVCFVAYATGVEFKFKAWNQKRGEIEYVVATGALIEQEV